MSDEEFCKSFDLIKDKIGRYALIDTEEFIYLHRIYGNYIWSRLMIKDLPAIPIKLIDIEVNSIKISKIMRTSIKPVWSFYTNNRMIVTPKVENYTFTQSLEENGQHSVSRRSKPNIHYIDTDNYHEKLENGIYVAKENAIEWNKQNKNIAFGFDDEDKLQEYISLYEKELKLFDEIYDKSAEVAEECKRYQRRYIR